MPFQRELPERLRLLAAARLVGSCAVSLVAQIAIDMPDGYFGGRDVVTRLGTLYSLGLLLVTALLVQQLLRSTRRPGWLVPTIHAVNVGLFTPAMASDPVVSGIVVVWNLTLLAQHFFPVLDPGSPDTRYADTSPEHFLQHKGPALRHLAGVSLVLTVAAVGYRLSGRLLTLVVCLVLAYTALAAALPALDRLRQAGHRSVWALALPVAASLASLRSPVAMLSWLAVAELYLLALLFSREHFTAELLHDFYGRPSRLIGASFATVISLGTILLTFPAASATHRAIAPLDALFTATSATCVTGLIVLDTPKDFSFFGQVVLLGLIQVGGLGIMVLSTFATLLLGGNLGLRGERALTQMLELPSGSTAYRLTRFIVLSTFTVEAVGAAILTWVFHGKGHGWAAALWRGVFHAVSAFCNAGFALQSDSLVGLQDNTLGLLTFAVLIVGGGLGFGVLAALWWRLIDSRRRPLSTQVVVVLAASAVLLALGTLAYLWLEWDHTLGGLSPTHKLLNAFFQSVTLRTAGFNSVGFESLAPGTLLVMVLFMFVGASPGSTGGGIKTTTVVVLLAAIRGIGRGGEEPRILDRRLPREIVDRSLAILVISGSIVLGGFLALLLWEDQPFAKLLFETVSAFGTVGLSLGATPLLDTLGKLFIIVLMFVGRVGPLTVALLIGKGSRGTVHTYRYPETRIMVG
ncbi:MAG: potassium transporter TrkG [Thermoanaerobaculia bacterium]